MADNAQDRSRSEEASSKTWEPEQPHSEAKSARSWGSLVITAVVSALAVVMLLAIGAPRWFDSATTNWAVTLGAGAATLVIVLIIGAMLRRRGREREDAPSRSAP